MEASIILTATFFVRFSPDSILPFSGIPVKGIQKSQQFIGTSIVALCPMKSLPRRLLSARLNPASSRYMDVNSGPLASKFRIRYTKGEMEKKLSE